MAQEVMLTEEQEARMNQHIKVYFKELGLSEDQKQVFKKITKKMGIFDGSHPTFSSFSNDI